MKALVAVLVLALLFFIYTGCFGGVQAASMWSQTYGGASYEMAYSLVETSDGGYAIVGTTDSFGSGNSDVWLVKVDELGNMQWNQTYGGPAEDYGISLVETSDGGFAIAGYTNVGSGFNVDFLLVKTDEFGVVPEAAWIILPLLLTASLTIFANKKKLFYKQY